MKNKVLALYAEYRRVYGPYKRKDNRKHIVLVDTFGRKKTVSWPKILLEIKIGRRLFDHETCDHKDDNFENDHPNNLQILSLKDNINKAFNFYGKRAVVKRYRCPICKEFFLKKSTYIEYCKRMCNTAGPFCTKTCAGKYGAKIQAKLKRDRQKNREG